MLEPQSRLLLLEALRPPEGYDFDFAIVTTYTLDLLAMLVAPVGFTLFELQDAPEGELRGSDALVLLSTLRRYAERMAVFCQAGRIAVPRRHALLFGHLEKSVIEVVAPTRGRSFHPKVWVLRFVAEGKPVQYRLLCLSRNLTFDRSWDTALVLDATVLDRKLGFAGNRPLADFVSALPAMAVRGSDVPGRIREHARIAADELRRAEFDIPEPFLEMAFHPLGIDGHRGWPFEERQRTLVVSPFVSTGCVERLLSGGRRDLLVARPEEMDLLASESAELFDEVLVLDPDLAAEHAGVTEEETTGSLGNIGLHAKLYVLEDGATAHVYTGSANATGAAFDGNVEFLVQLSGRKRDCGIDAILASEASRTGLRDVLRPYVRSPIDPVEDDEAIERRLDDVRYSLAGREWVARVEGPGDGGRYRLVLRALPSSAESPLPSEVRVRCWPTLLPESAAVSLDLRTDLQATFEELAFESLTAFFAFDVQLPDAPDAPLCRFLVNARLEGAPEGRSKAITQYLLRDRQQVVRFLLLLLADREEQALFGGDGSNVLEQAGVGREPARASDEALLEPLLRALDREPSRLDEVARIVNDLRATEEGRAKLPPGFDDVWAPIWAAREAIRS